MTPDVPAPICRCSGEAHLDTRDAIDSTLHALAMLRVAAYKAHSLTTEESRGFDRLIASLAARASELHHHAYAVHGVERMPK
jgi:hypothetical protein